MLKKLSREPPGQSTPDASSKLIPDPWELPNPAPKAKSSDSWKLPTEPHPLIRPAGSPEALQLSSAKLSPVQVLLQDWLKLRADKTKKLAIQITEALGLLCWIEMLQQQSPEGKTVLSS
ncbi:MAG: hypothetical protein AB4426_05740 [Xenococcaceae cyanobacterium]